MFSAFSPISYLLETMCRQYNPQFLNLGYGLLLLPHVPSSTSKQTDGAALVES